VVLVRGRQRPVVYESRLELARIMLADFDPAVTAVAAQPFRLIGRDGCGSVASGGWGPAPAVAWAVWP